MFSSKFYENLNSSYFKEIKKLEEKLAGFEKNGNFEDYQHALKVFSEDFLMPKELWEKLLSFDYHKSLIRRADNAYYQFYVTKDIMLTSSMKNHDKLLTMKSTPLSASFDQFNYPNSELENIFRFCERNSNSPIPKFIKQKYQKMTQLYDRIISVYEIEKLWFEALMEIEDEEFLTQNIEFRLGHDLTNKILWKLYIEFLKFRNAKKLLHTYSKYCRFFLDDFEMRAEYQKTAEEYGIFFVSWITTFDFETYCNFATREFLFGLGQKNVSNLKPEISSSSDRYFSVKNMKIPKFSFHQSSMKYLWEKSNAFIRQKLFHSCKYFFSQHPTPICYKLSLGYNDRYMENFVEESLTVKSNYLLKFRVENLHLSTTLYVRDSYVLNLLSSFIPQIFQCDAKFIEIWDQFLSFAEIQFLMESGNVEELVFYDVRIFDENSKDVPIENILKMTPKLKVLRIFPPIITRETAQILSKLPFENKLCKINLTVDEKLEVNAFAEFIKKNASSNCELKLNCKHSFAAEAREKFRQCLENAINEQWKTTEKPNFVMPN